ncbi:MAG: hypothetical protein PWR04_1578 [Anaerophaga sp.]|nr:hypothetical protein [Anaerophaga sp.]
MSFGDSKYKLVKPLYRILDVTPSNVALSAKCAIHDVRESCFHYYLSSGL